MQNNFNRLINPFKELLIKSKDNIKNMYDKNIREELLHIKKLLIKLENNSPVFGDWVPKKTVQKFFDYSDTQMRDLEKEQGLEFSKVKSRKFYLVKSILELLETNIIKTNIIKTK